MRACLGLRAQNRNTELGELRIVVKSPQTSPHTVHTPHTLCASNANPVRRLLFLPLPSPARPSTQFALPHFPPARAPPSPHASQRPPTPTPSTHRSHPPHILCASNAALFVSSTW